MTDRRHRPRGNNAGGDPVWEVGPPKRSETVQPKTGGERHRCLLVAYAAFLVFALPVDGARLSRVNIETSSKRRFGVAQHEGE